MRKHLYNDVAFVDTETTSLRHDRRVWELAVHVRRPDGPPVRREWLIHTFDLDLGNADLKSMYMNGFYDRHPDVALSDPGVAPGTVVSEYEALFAFERLTRHAHLVGANTPFDAEVLDTRMRANGILPSRHHRTQCVETLVRGYLAAKGQAPPLDMRADDLYAMVGIDTADYRRHEAMGDVDIAIAVWDTVYWGRGWPEPAVPAA